MKAMPGEILMLAPMGDGEMVIRISVERLRVLVKDPDKETRNRARGALAWYLRRKRSGL